MPTMSSPSATSWNRLRAVMGPPGRRMLEPGDAHDNGVATARAARHDRPRALELLREDLLRLAPRLRGLRVAQALVDGGAGVDAPLRAGAREVARAGARRRARGAPGLRAVRRALPRRARRGGPPRRRGLRPRGGARGRHVQGLVPRARPGVLR